MRPSIPRSIASTSRSILSSHPPTPLRPLSLPRHLSSSSASTSTNLISELESRNLVSHITSRALLPHLSAAPRTVYSGVDPSADSLHVGNLLPLLTLVHFARFHHNPIVLVGGATGSIGDPSGRSSERNALDASTLQRNVAAIGQQIRDFFSRAKDFLAESGSEFDASVTMMNNYEWMSRFTLLDFLSTVGRHSRMTSMLSRDSVASRLSPGAAGMSYTEFSYQLLQAYDFSFLHTHHSCTVQIGGSDQLGNITAGIDLIRRTSPTSLETPAYGMTLPLLTTSSGEKFGKSAGNAVWLSKGKTSDWKFYQFFLRSSDAEVERYLKCLTLLPVGEVERLMQEHEGRKKERKAQTALADHMTRLIRGKDAVRRCRLIAEVLFSHTKIDGDARDTLAQLNLDDIDEDDVVARLNRDDVVGVDVTRVVVKAGLVKSRGEAKRLAASGGLYVNNRQVAEGSAVGQEELVPGKDGRGGLCLVRAGKAGVKVVFVEQT
ncbi:likely mitochondrial tyrosyl-tRNA synthetase [Pseudozyma hubeiensis SY62]|uniref:Tyrosine--tRNA ligase n=1 Tax=Pseudozyma hubeiensis (strain SY62) TaxID=1305764 RepID=R9P2T3_PSEHS|nr:likely mitochondrial tyrosyl-tRNA synthetase [Pseudozyma hubeiensis SY62]GAC95728.1 likely mitochondrial tyrosyl-tRNA synthetase [Pseudozyma hubeiensis SY62]